MNLYVKSIFHQLQVANESLLELMGQIDVNLLDEKTDENKRTIRELLAHIVVIYAADYYIMEGSTQEEMNDFYKNHIPYSIEEMRLELDRNFNFLREQVSTFSEQDLTELKTSWWGVTYSRFEWLVEIVAHIYHHRAQLHTMLIEIGTHPQVRLFE
ncbi:DinB family protein [Bacillus sp. 31A1R]|uniref:DinB family protein n=1 Tax=Robertmurraya mangrovi TaxID=3098077 RepID=A0ABU5J0Z9_9BACI|nr:DinB family protein [Bacillus sp. 31A1R]MDZ5473035.1 DinB family protein [Bacillus sp. 31A1R]